MKKNTRHQITQVTQLSQYCKYKGILTALVHLRHQPNSKVNVNFK